MSKICGICSENITDNIGHCSNKETECDFYFHEGCFTGDKCNKCDHDIFIVKNNNFSQSLFIWKILSPIFTGIYIIGLFYFQITSSYSSIIAKTENNNPDFPSVLAVMIAFILPFLNVILSMIWLVPPQENSQEIYDRKTIEYFGLNPDKFGILN